MSKLWWLSSAILKSHLQPSEVQSLFSLMETSCYDKEQTIYAASLPGDALFVVQKGAVNLIYKTPMGSERVLNTLSQGDMFGSLDLIDWGSPSVRAVTLISTRVLVLRKQRFEQLLSYFPNISGKLIDGLRQELKTHTQEQTSHLQEQALKRYRRLLKHTSHLDYQYKPQDLSHLLGLSLQEAEGLVQRVSPSFN